MIRDLLFFQLNHLGLELRDLVDQVFVLLCEALVLLSQFIAEFFDFSALSFKLRALFLDLRFQLRNDRCIYLGCRLGYHTSGLNDLRHCCLDRLDRRERFNQCFSTLSDLDLFGHCGRCGLG